MSECKCDNITRYGDKHQCIKGECRKEFIPADAVDAVFTQWLDDRTAHVSVTGNMMIIVMKLEKEEIGWYTEMIDDL